MWIKMEPLIGLHSFPVQLSEQSVLIFEGSFTWTRSEFEALQVTRHELRSNFSGYIFSQLNNCIYLQPNNLCCDLYQNE